MEFMEACNISVEILYKRYYYVSGLSIVCRKKDIAEAISYIKNDVKLLIIGIFYSPQFERKMRKVANEKDHFIGKSNY